MIARILLFFALLVSMSDAHADIDTSAFYHFDLKNGLPSNNVYSVLKDKSGYMWIATDNGLVKYNGYTFELYNTESGGLPANDVYDISEDGRGRIWPVTFSNKFGYVRNGKYKAINYRTTDVSLKTQYVSNYKGLFYFSLLKSNGDYSIVVVDDDVIGTFNFNNILFSPQRDDSIYNVCHIDSFSISIWTAGNKLYTWDLRHTDRKPKYVGKFPEEFRYVYSHRIILSKEGVCYMFKPYGSDILIFNTKTLFDKKITLAELGADNGERIHTINQFSLKNNRSHHTTIMTNTHLYVVDPDFNLLSRVKNTDAIPSTSQIASRFADKKLGDSWHTTNKDGIWIKPAFYNFYAGIVKHSSLDNASFIGSINNATFWWDEKKSEICEVTGAGIVNAIPIHKNVNIKSITGNDTIAYIAATDGLYEYDRRNGKLASVADVYQISGDLHNFKDEDKKRSDEVVLSTFRVIKLIDNSLFAFAVSGLIKIDIAGDKISAYNFDTERFINSFHDKKSNRLYCYSNRKILIYNLANNTYKVMEPLMLEQLGIKNVRQLVKDDYGNVFILDNTSLNIYDEQTGKIQQVNTKFSLVDALMGIKDNQLYIASKSGIATADVPGKNRLGSFSILPNAGMKHYNRVGNFIVCDNGYVVMKTDSKWWSFTIDSLKRKSAALQNGFFSITAVKPLESEIADNDRLKIRQDEGILKLDAINYYGKGNLKFSYQVGDDPKWEESSSGEIFLSSLDAGKYHVVHVKVKDDLWESDTHTFYIYRYPHWWQTQAWKIVFGISGAVLFLVLVLLTVLITRHYVAKKNERRRALTNLELQAIHSQINPHFIFNSLSAALFYINKKRFDDAYTHVSKFSQLLRSYLKSSHDRYVILEDEIKMLRNYIELQQIRFEEKFEYRIEVDNKLPVTNIRIPSLLLQPLVENAINHGLFHREKGGILLLKFEQGADSSVLVCTIDDNGVGRDAARKINESTSTRESYGTTLTNQLLEVFKLYEKLDIKLDYTDKALPERGTVVTLTLKNIKYVA